MNMQLVSNKFYRNTSKNGGAIYFSGISDINNNENISESLTIQNNTFHENYAKYFGGAINSEYNKLYLATSVNNEFLKNKAGIMGGAIYTPKSIEKNLFDLTNNTFENNTVLSYNDNYNSKPSYIVLNTTIHDNNYINVGNYFALEFKLYNEFGDLVVDPAKYYSSITLKLIIEKKIILFQMKKKVLILMINTISWGILGLLLMVNKLLNLYY